MALQRRHLLQSLPGLAIGSLGLGALAHSPLAAAQASAFPQRPVRVVVPYPAGGATDILARSVAEPLGKLWQQPVVVENKPGAGGMIGAASVAKAEPDGYTALLTITGLVQAPLLYGKSPYDPVRDFAPASELGTTSLLFVVPGNSPANTLAEFIALVRSKPGQLAYGSFGVGSTGHLLIETFKENAKLDLTHVGHKGEAPTVTDLLGGQVAAAIISVVGAKPHVPTGRMKVLAVTGTSRLPLFPNVPTFAEAGVSGLDTRGWFGLLLPAKTPTEIVEKFSVDVNKMLALPAVRNRMVDLGVELGGTTPSQFAQAVPADFQRWEQMIRKQNIRLE